MQHGFEMYAEEVRQGLASDEAWEAPVPFDEATTPDFPLEALPKPLDAFVESLAETTQTPLEMGGLLSLAVLSVAFQNRYVVEINSDWREPLCLFTVAVAAPAERKSAVLSALTRPIYEYEAERRAAEAAEIAQNQTDRAILEKSLDAAKAAATKGKGDFSEKRLEALDLSAQLAEFKDLHPFRLICDDSTPEKLVDIMEKQGGSITVCSAEGGIFDTMQGRYDNRGGMDIFLKGHAGDSIVIDRIGRGGNVIQNPRLSMILTVQPNILCGLMRNSTFRGRGLCGRFLYAVCKSKVGRREISPPPIPESVKTSYRNFVRRILTETGTGVVHLSPEADRLRIEYQSYIEKQLCGELDFMADWAGKLTGAMLRIAALLHLASFPADAPISPDVMMAAVNIGEFLREHAKAAYMFMGSDSTQQDAKYLWKRIMNTGKYELSKRELFNLCRGRFQKVADMEAGLETLVSMGYIREITKETGGRPTKIILVNPYAKDAKGAKGG